MLILLLAGCSAGGASQVRPPETQSVSATVPAVFPSGWKFPAGRRASFAASAMVASSDRLAAEAGVEVLKAGGNAVDAAVAVGFALAVTYPEAGNIGGGGYMVIRLADGRTAALDYREKAPLASHRGMYLDSTGNLTRAGIVGRAASGVPGAVAGLTEAHAKYGSLPLDRVMAPAIRLAADGFIVDSALSRSVAGKRELLTTFAGSGTFFPGGQPIALGSRFVQPELAETLRLVAGNGADGFYRGRVADLIVQEMLHDCAASVALRERAAHGCGIMTKADLEKYKPVWREPVRTSFRGHTIISMPPSSSGGITLGETLNILDGYPRLPRFGSAEYLHLVSAAFQRSFIDRNALLGDPDFVKVPGAQLTSQSYATRLRRTIDPARATPTAQLRLQAREGTETTHYSVVDAAGNAASTTTTLNSLYGSGVFIQGGGFFMNNTMDDFTSQPGTANQFGLVQGAVNAIAPGKRMLSAMTPTIVLDQSDRLSMILGGRGGPRIITSTAQVILNVIEHRMSLADAMNAPRIHHQALPDTVRYDNGGFDAATIERLSAMGHRLSAGATGASVVAIRRVRGGYEGMDDPRGFGGAAVGY